MTYSGLDAEKTQLSHYPTTQPVVGDKFIATDTNKMYVLSALPFTSAGLWVELLFGGVNSVNGYSGAVSLTTDDIAEGVDKYFASGIAQYKSSAANLPNELLKLDAGGYIDQSAVNP